MPELSVIITAYNSATFLPETIRSVLDQTYTDFELIIIDDGSTDNTKEIVTKFNDPRIRYIYQENRGVPSARNAGIRASSGRYIALLDSDDLWLPQKLELQLKAFEMNPACSVVYTDVYWMRSSDSSIILPSYMNRSRKPAPRGKVFSQLAERFFGHPSCLLIKRDVFDKIGYFDENMKHADDYDLLLRIAAELEFDFVPLPLVKYRLHPQQLSKQYEALSLGHLALFDKALKLPTIDNRGRRSLLKTLTYIRYEYGLYLILRQRKFIPGFCELVSCSRIYPGKFIQLSLLMFWRLMVYPFKKLSLSLHLPFNFKTEEIF